MVKVRSGQVYYSAGWQLKILITDKCTIMMAFKKWREKGESFRPGVDRYRCIEGLYQIMSAKIKVTKMKTALKQETYNLSDLEHDVHCGFVELGARHGLGFIVTSTIDSKTFELHHHSSITL
jgi:hypothetical protein